MWEYPQCNATLEDATIQETPIWHDWTIHDIGVVVCAIFGLIAIVVSFFLIFMHATHYSRPSEQRHIIRILFMVPIYAAVSFLSFVYYRHSVYYDVLRDCYEAFAIASFFSLLCAYVAEDLHYQKEYFRSIHPKNWVIPMPWFQKCTGGEITGFLRRPRSGLTWFNIIWVAVFQYCFIRVIMTIVAVATQYFDRYCLESLNPAFAHVWVMVIEAIAVTIAMYCLIQFYVQIRHDITRHKPLLKVAAIKLVIFLSFWQTFLISLLTGSGAVTTSEHVAVQDLKIGIPAMLLCIEMSLFAVFHIWAFSYRPYKFNTKEFQLETSPSLHGDNPAYHGGFAGAMAILDAFNPWDLVKAVGRSAKWLFRDRKTRLSDRSYDEHIRPAGAVPGPITNRGEDDRAAAALGSGQKMDTIVTSTTAYHGAGTKLSAGTDANEEDQLLQNPQAMPQSRPMMSSRLNPSPPSGISDDYEMPDTHDIGVARSTYEDGQRRYGDRDRDRDQEWEYTPHPNPAAIRGGQQVGAEGTQYSRNTNSRTDYGYGDEHDRPKELR